MTNPNTVEAIRELPDVSQEQIDKAIAVYRAAYAEIAANPKVLPDLYGYPMARVIEDARRAALVEFFSRADDKDWTRLNQILGYSAHGKFWRGLLNEVRARAEQEIPLFIPLKTEWFMAFRAGTKDTEYRAYGPRWNERTCSVGRKAVLSHGYSGTRLYRTVAGFRILHREDAPTSAQALFPNAELIAAIHLPRQTPTETNP